MNHRPYPNTDRTLHQLLRHDGESGPFVPAAPLPEWRLNLARQASAVLAAAADRTAPIVVRLPQLLGNGGAVNTSAGTAAFGAALRTAVDAVRRAQDARPDDFVLR